MVVSKAITEEEKLYWLIWNQLYTHIGPVKFLSSFFKTFGSAKKAWEAPSGAFLKLGWDRRALLALNKRVDVSP